jgi:hypothetical protein
MSATPADMLSAAVPVVPPGAQRRHDRDQDEQPADGHPDREVGAAVGVARAAVAPGALEVAQRREVGAHGVDAALALGGGGSERAAAALPVTSASTGRA